MPPTFQRVQSAAPWEERYGYCRALRAGGLIFVTGTAPVGDDGKTLAPGDAFAQTERCLAIIERALKELGATRECIVRVRLYVTDITRADEYGRACKVFFAGHRPCMTMVGTPALIDPQMLVEIEVDAVAG